MIEPMNIATSTAIPIPVPMSTKLLFFNRQANVVQRIVELGLGPESRCNGADCEQQENCDDWNQQPIEEAGTSAHATRGVSAPHIGE